MFGASVPGSSWSARGVGGSGVGLLFEIWIVDASIFVVCCVHCLVWFIVGFGCGLCCLLVVFGRVGVWWGPFAVSGGGLGWWCV